jgi:flagellar biosynthetic protein FliO
VNTVAVIGRMLLALVFVLGVMWCLARWARKPMGAGKADRVMSILARQQLSRSSSIAVLRVMDRALVLGVTEQGIRLITETELSPIEDVLATEPAPSRAWSMLRPSRPALSDGSLGYDADHAGAAEHAGDADHAGAASQAGDGTGEVAAAGRRTVPVTRGSGRLDGSVFSPQTWRQLLSAARELTVRR